MAFIRTKRIYNQDYAYLVENEWTDKGSRQKSSKYLGKVFNIEKKSNFHRVEGLNYKEIILNLIKQELKNHSSNDFSFDEKKLTRGSRVVILAINEGFLCDHTIRKLLDFKPVHILKGEELANLLVEAGIKLTPDQFVELCEKVFPKEKPEQQEQIKPEEFYY